MLRLGHGGLKSYQGGHILRMGWPGEMKLTSERNESTNKTGFFDKRLLSWPLALVGLSLAFLLVASSVSAWGRRDSHDIKDVKSHAEHFLDRALDRLDATDEQSSEIRAIVMSTIADLHQSRGEFRSGQADFKKILLADSIDRQALEELRRVHLARADEMSRTLAESLATVVELLTPEQREQLQEHFDEHKGRHGRGHRGWGMH
jgi:Spy/CpxP family protein refolding chaperone